MAQEAKENSGAPTRKPVDDRVVLRPLPKLVFLWPLWLTLVVCAILVKIAPQLSPKLGVVVSFLFFANISVITFEFNRMRTVAMVLFAIVLLLLASMFNVFKQVFGWVGDLHIDLPVSFYVFWAVGFTILFIVVLIRSRLDYWEIDNNELMHHTGVLGDVKRWPAPDVRMTKEITDIFQYMLLLSGRMVFLPQGENRAIVLDNIMAINKKEKLIKNILSKINVQHVDS
ncbi:MAG: hypothetical protein KC609_14235 [Myxococcales bacterium]|nr:hypothetical protein [Myxococcales bacterium]